MKISCTLYLTWTLQFPLVKIPIECNCEKSNRMKWNSSKNIFRLIQITRLIGEVPLQIFGSFQLQEMLQFSHRNDRIYGKWMSFDIYIPKFQLIPIGMNWILLEISEIQQNLFFIIQNNFPWIIITLEIVIFYTSDSLFPLEPNLSVII